MSVRDIRRLFTIPLRGTIERDCRRPLLSLVVVTLLGLVVTATGCGPKVNVSPEFERTRPYALALLPISADPSVRKERLEYLQNAVRAELRSKGYYLLDNKIVNRICTDADCTKRSQLPSEYQIQAFAQLKLDNVSRANFLLGYINSLKGKLVLTDTNQHELIAIQQLEEDRGGVLFNSGQVLQGLKEEVRNFGDDSFNNLANRFAKQLVAQLPRPKTGSGSLTTERAVGATDFAPEITAVQVKNIQPFVYEICAEAPTNNIATLLANRRRSNLRETMPGKYCGIYRVESLASSTQGISVEVRSPFGNSSRKPITLASATPCDLRGHVALESDGKRQKLLVSCVQFLGKSSESAPGQGASENCTSSCSATKLLVYRGPTQLGPFAKVAELANLAWLDNSAANKSAYYQVVAVSQDGGLSLPAAPSVTNP